MSNYKKFFIVLISVLFFIFLLIIINQNINKPFSTQEIIKTQEKTNETSKNQKQLEYIQETLTPMKLQAKSLIKKQLTFVKSIDYQIDSLEISNFYPDKVEHTQMGFGEYPNTVTVNCLNIAKMQISNSEDISGWISTFYCLDDQDFNILKDRYKLKIESDHFIVNLELRGQHNSLVPEAENLIFSKLRGEWENLQESDWPSLEKINPLNIYTFNSNLYETSDLSSAVFYNSIKMSDKRNFFVIVTNFKNYLDGRVLVYNYFDLKSLNLSDLRDFYKTTEAYDDIEDINCSECGYKGYFLSKKSLNSILDSTLGENGVERLTAECNNKVVYIFNDIIFEIPVITKNISLTQATCGGQNINDCADSFQCLSREQKKSILEGAKSLMNFVLMPFKNNQELNDQLIITKSTSSIASFDDLFNNSAFYENKEVSISGYIFVPDAQDGLVTNDKRHLNIRGSSDMNINKNLSMEVSPEVIEKILNENYRTGDEWMKVEVSGTLHLVGLGQSRSGLELKVNTLIIKDNSCPLVQKFFNDQCSCPSPFNVRIGDIKNGFQCVGNI